MRKGYFALVMVLLVLVGCQQPPQTLPPPTVSVDSTIQPSTPSLPGFDGTTPRPIASIKDAKGTQADFVANELIIATDDTAALNTFISRWQGVILKTYDPAPAGLTGITKQFLVRVNVAAADTAKLSADLRTLDKDSRGALSVSSGDAHKLLAAAAQEKVAGLSIGVNWVSRGDILADKSSIEAPTGESISGTAYTTNAFNWPHLNSGSTQDIGVTDAWRALELAGKINNKVKIGILDMGFQPNADFPEGWLAISNVPFKSAIGSENLLSCSGGNPCPWHGTAVAEAAAGKADNNFGAAGPAGPVADLVLVYTSYDYFTAIGALTEARIAGAKIINMSFGAPVPAALFWTALPFEVATRAIRLSGALLFASAGNDGKNVEAEDCFFVCWEETWWVPCENGGVICIGGLGWDSKNRASGSNYSSEDGGDDDQDVELFAPYTMWVGPDPDNPDNKARRINGTSFSSPFAAGVAALIWAAKPSLSAGEVDDIIHDTAHSSPDPKVKKYVNALAAVKQVLGNVPPSVQIISPSHGGTIQIGQGASLDAIITDFEDAAPCCTVTWASSKDGNLGTGRSITFNFPNLGPRTITATAKDSAGATNSASVSINVVNTTPTVTISKPSPADVIFRNVDVVLRGNSFDPNEPGFALNCNSLKWTSNRAEDPSPTGCETTVKFTTLGARTLTLSGTDSHGASAVDTVTVSVTETPPNLPPNVTILSPADGFSGGPESLIPIRWSATDPQGETPLTLKWEVTWPYDKNTGTGPNTATFTPKAGPNNTFTWTPKDTIPGLGCEFSFNARIKLTATDPGGNSNSDFVVIFLSLIC